MTAKQCLLSILVLTSITISATAQKRDTLRWITLPELEVTPLKQEKQFRVMPVAAFAVNSGVLKQHNVVSVKDLVGFVPNLFMPEYGSKLTSPLYIRGIGSKINAPSVGLYVDGIPYFEKSSFDFDFREIERVEVLRGPQGTLYGRNTMASA